ncbi:isochorismatase family cysteine hydrolase [Nocardioides sp.]|uniref:cysteine hydrolase family protein n=1 Tax=Nocardioides sp. TaxID=35761 RepID=UPI002CFAEBEB|nr:isochorismatase family cysteine hydrolase [Nocardioides sp.]HXH79415.1 isochorismatase family cysteine hydrolase [Nocardioides sp.]
MGTSSPSSTALILIDMQKWITELSLHPHVDGVVQKCQTLRATAGAAGAPIYHIRYLERAGARADPDSVHNQIVKELAPREDDVVITKYGIDAFAGTELHATLQGAGVVRVALAGIATAHAVAATAQTAVSLGYAVTVLSDATASLSPREHTEALNHLRTIVTVEPCAALAAG